MSPLVLKRRPKGPRKRPQTALGFRTACRWHPWSWRSDKVMTCFLFKWSYLYIFKKSSFKKKISIYQIIVVFTLEIYHVFVIESDFFLGRPHGCAPERFLAIAALTAWLADWSLKIFLGSTFAFHASFHKNMKMTPLSKTPILKKYIKKRLKTKKNTPHFENRPWEDHKLLASNMAAST